MPKPSGNKTAGRNRAREAGETAPARPESTAAEETRPREIGGPRGPEPTRYGDWEVKGRCSDF